MIEPIETEAARLPTVTISSWFPFSRATTAVMTLVKLAGSDRLAWFLAKYTCPDSTSTRIAESAVTLGGAAETATGKINTAVKMVIMILNFILMASLPPK